MTSFWVRSMTLVLIIGILLGYNSVLEAREQEDTIARMSAELETEKLARAQLETVSAAGSPKSSTSAYTDGVYEGIGQGFGGDVQVEVTISGGELADVTVVSAAKEDGAYFAMAEGIIPDIIAQQSTAVDTASGATFSSDGILDAVENALEKAEQ